MTFENSLRGHRNYFRNCQCFWILVQHMKRCHFSIRITSHCVPVWADVYRCVCWCGASHFRFHSSIVQMVLVSGIGLCWAVRGEQTGGPCPYIALPGEGGQMVTEQWAKCSILSDPLGAGRGRPPRSDVQAEIWRSRVCGQWGVGGRKEEVPLGERVSHAEV